MLHMHELLALNPRVVYIGGDRVLLFNTNNTNHILLNYNIEMLRDISEYGKSEDRTCMCCTGPPTSDGSRDCKPTIAITTYKCDTCKFMTANESMNCSHTLEQRTPICKDCRIILCTIRNITVNGDSYSRLLVSRGMCNTVALYHSQNYYVILIMLYRVDILEDNRHQYRLWCIRNHVIPDVYRTIVMCYIGYLDN